MKNLFWFLILNSALAAFSGSLIYGSEVAFPAAQVEQGKCSFFLLYGNSSDKLNFNVTGRDQIKVGNNSYFSNVSNDLESDGSGKSVFAKVVINPDNGLYYWFKAGISSYDLDVPSDSVKNKLSGQDKGMVCGFGARKLLFPDTIVTPAIAVDFGINYAAYGLDSFSAGGAAPVAVSDKLEIMEFQTDLVLSKRIKQFEPYGGLKIYRKTATLTDKAGFANVSGTKDNAGLFFGLKVNFTKQEALVIEGSLVGDSNFSVGLNIGL